MCSGLDWHDSTIVHASWIKGAGEGVPIDAGMLSPIQYLMVQA